MGRNSSIEWTHHTFNPWWGCTKVSPACRHCYAETWARRVGQDVWGVKAPRRFFTDAHWREPLIWNREAADTQTRRRVFCASMADVFEARSDLNEHRSRLWELIAQTPWLDWLLLTKRPGSVLRLVPWQSGKWPPNVWLGTTVENQLWADKRVPLLLECPAITHFLSCEPLLGPINLSKWLQSTRARAHFVSWVIAGGESGPGARPMLPNWARLLRDQCRDASIAFHFKQWGHWAPVSKSHSKAEKIWDDAVGRHFLMAPKGKKDSGRSLDGSKWNQIPIAIAA